MISFQIFSKSKQILFIFKTIGYLSIRRILCKIIFVVVFCTIVGLIFSEI